MPAGPHSYTYGPLSFTPTGPLIVIDLHCYNVALFSQIIVTKSLISGQYPYFYDGNI